MGEQALTPLIEKLREEIANLPAEDRESRERLEKIAADLEDSLGKEASHEHGLVSSIQDTVHDIEARHPDATTVLNNIMMALANIGI